jgi:hypothetical protein
MGPSGFAVMIQSCDPFLYFDMLVASSRSNREFCRRSGVAYAAFVGVRRGFHPWQAAFNRICLLHDYVVQGFGGWVIYLDADAFVWDLDFDVRGYLSARSHNAAVLTPSGLGVPDWSVNDGVAFFNLSDPVGRCLVRAWHDAFSRVDEQELRAAGRWDLTTNDQDMLQAILRGNPWLRRHVFLERPELLNSRDGRFIRQVLRAQIPDLAARTRVVAAEAEEALWRVPRRDKA